ncbi:MAG: C40 family peptidase [Epsilonproteobacteria bacterium]|nr:C40 family peptidase [Campylobacterota bacterium]
MFNCIYKDGGREYPYFDCYGFVKYFYKKHNGVDMIDFIYQKADDVGNEKLYYEHLKDSRWKRSEPQKGAVVGLRVNGYISHIGLMLNKTDFIHIMKSSGVRINKITHPQWKNRVVGFYKYA